MTLTGLYLIANIVAGLSIFLVAHIGLDQARSQAWANPGSARVAQVTARAARDGRKYFFGVKTHIFSRCTSLKITSMTGELQCLHVCQCHDCPGLLQIDSCSVLESSALSTHDISGTRSHRNLCYAVMLCRNCSSCSDNA